MVWYEVKWYGIRWHGMVCNMVLVWVGYGMGLSILGTVVLVWSSYTTLEWGTLGTLNQGIDVPHRYPKMDDWSAHAVPFSFQYHLTSYHTIGIIKAFQFQSKPYHHSKAVTGCLGSFFTKYKIISAGCNTCPLGSIFCGQVLQIFAVILSYK